MAVSDRRPAAREGESDVVVSGAARASFSGYGLTLAGRFGSAVANVASLLVLVRALPPEGIGVFSLAVSTIAVLATVADAGLRTGFVRRISRRSSGAAVEGAEGARVAPLIGGIIAFEHLFGLALGVVLLAARRSFANAFFGGEAGVGLVALIASGILAHNAYHVATAPAQARQDFRSFFGYQIAWAVARLAGIAFLAATGVHDPVAYLVAHVGSLALTAAGVLVVEPETSLRTLSGAWGRRAFREAFADLRSAHWVATGSLLFIAMSQLGVFALGHWSTLAEVGRFAAVQRFVQVFQIAISALWTFLLPKVLGYDARALAEYVRRLRARFPGAALLVLVGCALAALVLPLLLPPTLGDLRVVLILLGGAALAEAYASLLSIVFLNAGAYAVVVCAAAAKLALATLLAAAWAQAWGAPGAAAACFVAEALGLIGLALSVRALMARLAIRENGAPRRFAEGRP